MNATALETFAYDKHNLATVLQAVLVKNEVDGVELEQEFGVENDETPCQTWASLHPHLPFPLIVKMLDPSHPDARGTTGDALLLGLVAGGFRSPHNPKWDDLIAENSVILADIISGGHAIASYLGETIDDNVTTSDPPEAPLVMGSETPSSTIQGDVGG